MARRQAADDRHWQLIASLTPRGHGARWLDAGWPGVLARWRRTNGRAASGV